MQQPFSAALVKLLDQSYRFNSLPFDPQTSLATPQGIYGCVHYGIMVPNLPAPHNFLNIITVIGQPQAKIFRNAQLIKTTALDTANLLVGTGTGTPDHFQGYSVKNDCDLKPDGSYLRFADDLVLQGQYPHFTVRRQGKAFNVELTLRATDKVANFAQLVGGLYDHWSILCEYEGHIEQAGVVTPVQGLCTYEYARAANVPLPFKFFTYHILNIDERTQVLMVQVLGPMGMHVQRRVYVRTLDDHGRIYSQGFDFTVQELEAEPVVTPYGAAMRLPKRFSWRVDDERGRELIAIQGLANGDFNYGMAAGYAGSYEYQGRYKGKPINGRGYMEYIDQR